MSSPGWSPGRSRGAAEEHVAAVGLRIAVRPDALVRHGDPVAVDVVAGLRSGPGVRRDRVADLLAVRVRAVDRHRHDPRPIGRRPDLALDAPQDHAVAAGIVAGLRSQEGRRPAREVRGHDGVEDERELDDGEHDEEHHGDDESELDDRLAAASVPGVALASDRPPSTDLRGSRLGCGRASGRPSLVRQCAVPG